MNNTIVTDYDNITSSSFTDYDNIASTNCTNNENNIEIDTSNYINSLWNVTYMFNIPCGIYLNQTFFKQKKRYVKL